MPAIPKNTSQSFSVELRDIFGNLDTATTGAPTINLCKDGTWAVAANAATNTKAGYWTVTLTQAETNYREIIVEAVKAGFVTWSRTFYPEPDYTTAKAAYLDEAISAAKTLAANAITAAVIATDAIDADALKADAVTEIQNGLATPTNITAGTITTVTNLTNAPTNGDLTATMKASIASAVWNALTSGLTTAGSIGKKLADWVVGTIDTYTGNTPQTGDAYARIGAAGAGLTALGDTRIANLDATVSSRLAPTVAARTLDVSVGGEAGIDLANVGSPTTALNLSGTTISTSQQVASVSGAVGSVTGAVGSVTGNVGGNVSGTVKLDATQAAYAPAKAGDAMTLTSGERNSTAAAILGLADGVETSLTVKQALQLIAAFAAGNGTGLDGSTLVFKAANNSGTTRITAAVTSSSRTNTLNI